MNHCPLQDLKAKRQMICNKASLVAFFGMEVATTGWVKAIGFEPHVWMIDHGLGQEVFGEDPYRECVWNALPSQARLEVEQAIGKMDLLAKDDKIAIVNHADRIFIALAPGMVFLPAPVEIGPGLGLEGVDEEDFSHGDFLRFFHDRGFDVVPAARDFDLEGSVITYLAKDVSIFGLPALDGQVRQ